MLPRVALALCAVLAVAWLGVLVRDREVGEESAAPLLYQPNMSEARFQRYVDRLGEATFLNPDPTVDIVRATYQLVRGHREVAAVEAERIVRREPQNLTGWSILYRATRGRDPAEAARAAAAIRRLNPLSSRSSG
jgi:hypothetical protein